MNDLIKREDSIEAIDTMICDNKWVCEYRINSLPTAEPQGELISKKDVVKAVTNYIWHLPNECYKNFNSYNDIEEVVTDAVKQLPSTNDNWIPVSEMLPAKRRSVLITTNEDFVGEACYWATTENHVIWKGYRWEATYWDDEVIAWMPLPTPYKESEVEE